MDADEVEKTDEELKKVVKNLETKITVIGCGGGGSNTINRIQQEGIKGARLIATNTDAQHLLNINADKKILIGQKKTKGRGAGSVPKKGEEAALESQEGIKKTVENSDMVFITAGLGGGTGTGAAPVIAQAAQDEGALTIGIVTTPFESEGQIRKTNAQAGLERLKETCDTVIVVPNDKLLQTAGNLPLNKAFKIADEVLMRSVKGITELITKRALVNLDFADIQTIMQDGGVAMIGLGESDTENRAQDSIKKALNSPLLDVNIEGATSALINVTGGPNMTVEEAEKAIKEIHEKIQDNARIIWGASIDPNLEKTMRTMIVTTGVKSPQIYGNKKQQNNNIDFVE